MSLLLVVALAVFQGVAEFLPISSSAHLRLLETLFGVHEPQVLFDVMLHVGTLFAVIWVYRALLGRMLHATAAALRSPRRISQFYRKNPDFRLTLFVALGTLPTVLAVVLASPLRATWGTSLPLIGLGLLTTSLLLSLLNRRLRSPAPAPARPLSELTWKDALLIGSFQGLSASFRGISRSGSTLTAGVLGGLRQDAAAAFSFLLSIPAVLGALLLSIREQPAITKEAILLGLLGAFISAVIGVFALRLLLNLLERGRMGVFALWCLLVGSIAIVWGLLP